MGSKVWVENRKSATEIDGNNGSLVQVDPGVAFGDSFVNDGADFWVGNGVGTFTEFDGTNGDLIQTATNPDAPLFTSAATIIGAHLWVANYSNKSISEFNTSDGSWIQTIRGSAYRFKDPEAIVAAGSDLWVTNGSDFVTQIDSADGSLASAVHVPHSMDAAIAFDGTNVWVTEPASATGSLGAVAEIDPVSGAVLRTLY